MPENISSIEIKQIWVSPGHDFKGRHGIGRCEHGVVACPEIECRAGQGIVGDRYFDFKPDFKGQITFFSADVADELEATLNVPSLDRSSFRRNVLVSGVDLNGLIGRQFRLGEVVLSGSEECSPCYWMDEAVAPGAFEFLKGRGGLRCRIVVSGHLKLGKQSFELIA